LATACRVWIVVLTLFARSCIPYDHQTTTDSGYKIDLDYKIGVTTSYKNIYVAWIEDQNKSFCRYIYICERLDYATFTGTSGFDNIKQKAACPYWRKSLYETPYDDAVDAISGPTKGNTDFSASITLPKGSPKKFTVYFEIDRSFDNNDWWTDQPAILYSADIDIDSITTSGQYTLTARGWSRNAGGGSGGNENKYTGNPVSSGVGELQTELRYISNTAASNGTAFGPAYGATSANNAMNMTKSITLTVTKL
jgi:hypothetical protein